MPPEPIESVLETCLYARDLDAAERFYGSVLGLERVSRVEGRHVFFRCGRQMVLLFQPEKTAGEETLAHGADGPGHVAFAMPDADLDDWRAYLEDEGIEIEAMKTWGASGDPSGRSLYIRDPAGNSVELADPGIWPLEG
jgi:catechol 2,3-dioxygenase-like lactoylglutathione lyase family enzyme